MPEDLRINRRAVLALLALTFSPLASLISVQLVHVIPPGVEQPPIIVWRGVALREVREVRIDGVHPELYGHAAQAPYARGKTPVQPEARGQDPLASARNAP